MRVKGSLRPLNRGPIDDEEMERLLLPMLDERNRKIFEETGGADFSHAMEVDGVRWRGVRFKDLLAKARPRPGAHALQFVSAEQPYVDYLTLDQALLPDVMLAWEMDGQPLRQEHGAPVRVVIPDMYGYKNVKWVAEINLLPKAGSGYWENLGYDRDAWVGRSNGYTS